MKFLTVAFTLAAVAVSVATPALAQNEMCQLTVTLKGNLKYFWEQGRDGLAGFGQLDCGNDVDPQAVIASWGSWDSYMGIKSEHVVTLTIRDIPRSQTPLLFGTFRTRKVGLFDAPELLAINDEIQWKVHLQGAGLREQQLVLTFNYGLLNIQRGGFRLIPETVGLEIKQ